MKHSTTIIFFIGLFFIVSNTASGTVWDCLWGGSNETTEYTRPYMAGMGGVTLNQVASPGMNLGAPQPAIPVQATPNTQSQLVPQATIPTIHASVGPVGSVGQPATSPHTGSAPSALQAPPGTEIVYVLPSQGPGEEECQDGVKRIPAISSTIVPPGTPGAIPVAVRTINVIRPKVEYHWSYSTVRQKKETLVKVVDPRTGRVVGSFCREDEEHTSLPWPHRKEVVTYETVSAKVGTPINVAAAASASANTVIQGATAPVPFVRQQVNYPLWDSSATSIDGNAHTTIVLP